MSSRLTTAFLGSAILAGSVSGVAFAQDSTTEVKPCLGELCPPKSSGEDMPKQTIDDANQAEQMSGQEQSSDQVTPRNKKQASQQQESSGVVTPRKKKQAQQSSGRKKKQASQQQQQPSKKSYFFDRLFGW